MLPSLWGFDTMYFNDLRVYLCIREKAFEHPFVREFAVEVLRAASVMNEYTYMI